jgi:hypothetical protein
MRTFGRQLAAAGRRILPWDEMIPPDQAIPHDQLFAIALAALKLDHFQRTGDPCIRTGKKPHMIGANHGRKD